jgi:hypothetical protein
VTKQSTRAPAAPEVLPAVPHANSSLILHHGGSRSESFHSVEAFVSTTVQVVRALPTRKPFTPFGRRTSTALRHCRDPQRVTPRIRLRRLDRL